MKAKFHSEMFTEDMQLSLFSKIKHYESFLVHACNNRSKTYVCANRKMFSKENISTLFPFKTDWILQTYIASRMKCQNYDVFGTLSRNINMYVLCSKVMKTVFYISTENRKL